MAGGAHPYFGTGTGEGGEPLPMPAYNGLGSRYEAAGRVARSTGRQRGGRKSALLTEAGKGGKPATAELCTVP